MEWYLAALKQYAVFSGRARRREYWTFVLVNFIVVLVLTGVDSAVGTAGVLAGLFNLAMLVPGIAVGTRRLHDTDRSGWLLLIGLIPLVGAIVLIVFFVQDSQPGDNQYGPNPKVAASL